MKLISFNVNGIRASMKKGLKETLGALDADIVCLQETKATEEQVHESLKDVHGYHIYANSAERKGYSSVAILTKEEPVRVDRGSIVKSTTMKGGSFLPSILGSVL